MAAFDRDTAAEKLATAGAMLGLEGN
jgi:hypothetical protein